MSRRIALIGAGSVVFAKNLMSDILQFPELADSAIVLMDIDPARLRVAKVMAEKLIQKLGARARVEATLDRTRAIRGANYVICTIQAGGYKPGTVTDFEIPKRFGLRQTIADTLGVGGVFRALRTAPRLLEIARDIADVGAPRCLLLNYSNPMAMLCMAVDKGVGIPHVGLCHSVQATSNQLARYCGLNPRHVTFKVAGINHMAFFLEFKYRGRDAYPLLFNLLHDPSLTRDKVRFEMMRRTGYFVTESSEHQSEYVPYFIHHGEEMIRRFDIPIDEYLRRCESIVATWKRTERDLLGRGAGIQIRPQTHEYGSYIIHSVETDTPRVVYGNVPNLGLITNLPHRCCVEVPVLVDAQGLQPTVVGALPPQLAALCRSNINVQELAVEAVLTGRREHIYHAVMADPHTAATLPLDKIWAMCDELIAAHQKHGLLGEFQPVIPGTGRALAGTGDKVFARIAPTRVAEEIERGAEFNLELRNTSSRPFKGRIGFRFEGGAGRVRGGAVAVQVPAGRTANRRVTIQAAPHERELSILPVNRDPRFLGMPYEHLKRRRIEVPASAGAKARTPAWFEAGAPVELEFMGSVLLRGHVRLDGGAFAFRWRVWDTDVKLDRRAPWAASSIELFLRDSHGHKPIFQAFLLPENRRPRALSRRLQPLPDVELAGAIDKGGYWMEGAVPLAVAGIQDTGGGFLADVIVNAGALGDAHSACRAGWNGRLDSSANSVHFALMIPAKG